MIVRVKEYENLSDKKKGLLCKIAPKKWNYMIDPRHEGNKHPNGLNVHGA